MLISFYESLIVSIGGEMPDLTGWSGNVLLVNSKDDTDTRDKFHELVEAFHAARVHVFGSGGHHTQMLFPEEFTRLLISFVSE